ncbi:MAG: hypothetical protein JEZ06_20295 [Anaerolineaceae bacterium]|nr:hypothetical protein [Anaerolineaceae bacterium]
MKLITNIGMAFLFIIGFAALIFGFLFILGAFSPEGQTSWIITGVIIGGIGLGCIAGGIALFIYSRKQAKTAQAGSSVNLNIDLPGQVSLESMKCQSCGGVLSSNNINMVAGAPVVSCPFCDTSYQLTEEPKW